MAQVAPVLGLEGIPDGMEELRYSVLVGTQPADGTLDTRHLIVDTTMGLWVCVAWVRKEIGGEDYVVLRAITADGALEDTAPSLIPKDSPNFRMMVVHKEANVSVVTDRNGKQTLLGSQELPNRREDPEARTKTYKDASQVKRRAISNESVKFTYSSYVTHGEFFGIAGAPDVYNDSDDN